MVSLKASPYRGNLNKHFHIHLSRNTNIQQDQKNEISEIPHGEAGITSSSSKFLSTGTKSVRVPPHQVTRKANSLRALVEYSDDPLLAIQRPDSPQKIIFSKQCDICSKVN